MKQLVYVLSKNGTVKNYVSEVLIQADENDEESVNVSIDFTTEIEEAVDLVDATNDVYSQLVGQFGERLVGIEGGSGMKYQGKSMMSLNEMARLAIDYEGDGYVTGYPIVSGDDAYILNGVIEANEEYIVINQWVPVFPESIETVSPSLTDDQQVVLEWLKKDVGKYRNISYSVSQVSYLALTPMGKAWGNLSTKQQFQVLAAFAEWGCNQ